MFDALLRHLASAGLLLLAAAILLSIVDLVLRPRGRLLR